MDDSIKIEYKELLDNYKYTPADIARKSSKWRKEYLYRYRSFNNNYWESEIKRGEIYLPKPSSFNDPMDCSVFFDMKKIKEASEFWSVLQQEFNVNRKHIIDSPSNDNIIEDIANGYREDIGCACFTQSYQNILMWGHYAEKHSGFCIRYNVEKMGKLIRDSLFPVLYMDEKPDLTMQFNEYGCNMIILALVSKASQWEYEDEWRVLSDGKKNRFYEKEAIDTIYLGAKCTDENRQKVIEYGNEAKINVIQMKIDSKNYELREEKLK